MQFTFCPLYSGSSGNAIYAGAGDTSLLIDAGMSGKAITDALLSIGVLPETLGGILVTHEHSDHIKGVGILSRKYRIPVYANAPTWLGMEKTVGSIPPGCRNEFEDSFYLGPFYIQPYAISHDAAAPVGYRVHLGDISVATATDIGIFRKDTLEALSGTAIVLIESNHDVSMLQANPHYSLTLKHRILSNKGHMSNEACGEALCRLYERGVRHAVLGHLSGENNTPDLAYTVVCGILREHGIEPQRDMRVDMAYRDHVGKVYVLE